LQPAPLSLIRRCQRRPIPNGSLISRARRRRPIRDLLAFAIISSCIRARASARPPRVICCGAWVRSWHEATDRILIGDGRFRGEADMRDRVASTCSAVDGPTSDIDRRSSLLAYWGVLSFRSEAREVLIAVHTVQLSAADQAISLLRDLHQPARRRRGNRCGGSEATGRRPATLESPRNSAETRRGRLCCVDFRAASGP
jgi:hypothetical protein